MYFTYQYNGNGKWQIAIIVPVIGYDSVAKSVLWQNMSFIQEEALITVEARSFGWHSHMGFTHNPNISIDLNIVTHLPSALPDIM